MPGGLSLGRIQAGFAQATQEITVAAANLNFDFSLVKLAAPAEYQPIGNILTPSRVREAETGSIHVTARRLGALFEGACPETPNLIKAYGTRASEISKEVSESDAEKNNGRCNDWIRNEYGGIDATSIWAAATSSKAALPVHLLACIIARMWSHTEATSVWAEIVAERKREIASKFDDGEHIPITLASAIQQEITRDHLSKWDTSARAWLQTADKARQKQYTQFLLIVNNLSIAVNQGQMPLYSNVINVWTSALNATEGLISGKPHAVQNGPVLLGLSAWHIFPDMLVFDNPTGSVLVFMNDPLVEPGGVLSLGISDSSRKGEQGVYWSLSLSHHRYYGEAVRRTRRLESDGSRLSFNELVLVCLGSLLKVWSIPKQGIGISTKLLQAFSRARSPNINGQSIEENWQTIIDQPLKQLEDDEKGAILAMSLGRRRPGFVPQRFKERPFFGLLHLPDLLRLVGDPERKISLLRRLARRVPGLNDSNSIILASDNHEKNSFQYATVYPPGLNGTSLQENHGNDDQGIFRRWINVPSHIQNTYYDAIKSAKAERDKLDGPFSNGAINALIARAMLQPQTNPKHEIAGCQQSTFLPISSWALYEGLETDIMTDSDCEAGEEIDDEFDSDSDLETEILQDTESFRSDGMQTKDSINRSEEYNSDESGKDDYLYGWRTGALGVPDDQPAISATSQEQKDLEAQQQRRLAALTSFSDVQEQALANFKKLCSKYLVERRDELPGETFEYQNLMRGETSYWKYERISDTVTIRDQREKFGAFFGQERGPKNVNLDGGEYAMVYATGKGNPTVAGSGIGSAPNLTIDDLLWCFEHDIIDPMRLKEHLQEEPAFGLFRVLAAVGEIYSEPISGGATISCSIVDNLFNPPIFSMNMNLDVDDWNHTTICLNDTTAMALIAYFETGNNFIESIKGQYRIIGFSGGDSIFMRTAIINDPETVYPDYSFTRILGNTGKAGFSILTSPSELMVRKLDPSAWRVESTGFDGLPLDSFKQTSLHLSFTDWQTPVVKLQSVGQRDAEINIVEAVVSVRDAGRWVADVDIHRALSNPRLRTSKRRSEGCKHVSEGQDKGSHYGKAQEEILSLESWDQVLDQVDGSAVVRCFGNWVARLAIVSVLCQHSKAKDRPVIVCSKRTCLKCDSEHLREGKDFTYVF